MPELSPLVNTPQFASVLATLLVVTSEALLAQQQVATATASATASTPGAGTTTGGSSSSSGSRCSSTSSGSTNSSSASRPSSTPVSHSSTAGSSSTSKASAPKGKGVHRWVKDTLKNLPECTKALLETLGMDNTAVVWAAAAQRDKATFDTFYILTFAFSRLMRCMSTPAAGGVGVVMSPTCKQAPRQQLLLLVPATLLHWASNTRATTHEHMQQRLIVASCGGDIISCWLRSSKVVVADLPSDTGSNLQADGPWLQPFFPAAWLEQVLPDIHELLTVLLQRPWGPPAATRLSVESADKLVTEAPGQLVQLQCRILQSAVGRDEKHEVPSVGAGSQLCTFRPVQHPNEQELMQPLPEFRSVTGQTLANFEGFIRASAQQLAAGNMLSSQAVPAVIDIHAAVNGYGEPGPLLCLAIAAGPGSPEQQQLYSLLSSLIKLSALGANSSLAASERAASMTHSGLTDAAVSASIALLDWQLAQDFENCGSSSSSSNSRTPATQHSAGALTIPKAPSTAAAVAVALLPSLVLVGRCFFLWAQHLQQAVPLLLQLHAVRESRPPLQALMGSILDGSITCSALAVVFLCFSQEAFATTVWQTAASCIWNWLTAPTVAGQLAAAGHDTQQLPQLLQNLLSACRTAAEAWPSDHFTEATAMALVQQLQGTGRALAGLAVPTICCNPSCSNITGPSDLQLVSGRSCLCGGCRTARYCSRTCQKAAWKQHKPACSALAAAAAGTGAAAELETEPQATS